MWRNTSISHLDGIFPQCDSVLQLFIAILCQLTLVIIGRQQTGHFWRHDNSDMIRVSCMCDIKTVTLWEYLVCMIMKTLWDYHMWHWLTWWQSVLWDTDKSIINSLLGRQSSYFTPCCGQTILRWQPNMNCISPHPMHENIQNEFHCIWNDCVNKICYEISMLQ